MSWLSKLLGKNKLNELSRKARTLRDEILSSADWKDILRQLTQGELAQLKAMVEEALRAAK